MTLTRKIYFSASSDERAVLTGAANATRLTRKSKLGKSQIIAPGAMGQQWLIGIMCGGSVLVFAVADQHVHMILLLTGWDGRLAQTLGQST